MLKRSVIWSLFFAGGLMIGCEREDPAPAPTPTPPPITTQPVPQAAATDVLPAATLARAD